MKRCLALLALTLMPALSLSCGGGGKASTPTAPSSSGPRILLAGQSNAYFLWDHIPDAITVIDLNASINYYLQATEFRDKARSGQLSAFVWWHGKADAGMASDEYAQKLRSVIEIARSANPGLPVRIVEIPDRTGAPSPVKDAQRQVARDPGVEMISTDDLQLEPEGHFVPTAYPLVRDRIYRSLGR